MTLHIASESEMHLDNRTKEGSGSIKINNLLMGI
jgi:hypothetical protein